MDTNYIEYLAKQQAMEETMDTIREGVINKRGKANMPTDSLLDIIVRDIVNEFLAHTNRDEVPTNAIGLIEDMVIKRILRYEDADKDVSTNEIKSYTQGNISITYKDNVQKDYELTDSEKKLIDRFKISKATRYVKRRG